MSIPTILLIATAALMLVWAVWFNIRLIQYIRSGEYEMDRRLREISKQEGS